MEFVDVMFDYIAPGRRGPRVSRELTRATAAGDQPVFRADCA
jgi:hypothetical protein